MKFVFPVCIVGTGNKHFRSEKNSWKPSQEPYKQNNFLDFWYLESFWRNKRTDKHTFTLLIGDVGSSAIIFGMKTTLQQNVVIYFFSCLWCNKDFEVSQDPLLWNLDFRFALRELEISTSGQKKIVENVPRNHTYKTIFWICDMLSRFGEISEHTDRQTHGQPYFIYMRWWKFSHHFRDEDDIAAKCCN